MVVIVDVNRGLCSGCPEVPYRLDWTNAQGYYRCYLAWYEYRGDQLLCGKAGWAVGCWFKCDGRAYKVDWTGGGAVSKLRQRPPFFLGTDCHSERREDLVSI